MKRYNSSIERKSQKSNLTSQGGSFSSFKKIKSQSLITSYVNSHRYNKQRHARFIFDWICVQNVSISAVDNKEFREIQNYYCTGPSMFENNGLHLNRKKLVDVFLPFLASEAIENLAKIIVDGPLISRGYTYLDDGWTSRAKRYVFGL